MPTTIPPVTPYPDPAPDRTDSLNFRARAISKVTHDIVLAGGPGTTGELNTSIAAMNTVAGEMEDLRDEAGVIKDETAVIQLATDTIRDETEAIKAETEAIFSSVAAFAGFRGPWESLLPGAINLPASVYHNEAYWMLLENLSDVTAQEPGVSPKWAILLNIREIQSKLNLSLFLQGVI